MQDLVESGVPLLVVQEMMEIFQCQLRGFLRLGCTESVQSHVCTYVRNACLTITHDVHFAF